MNKVIKLMVVDDHPLVRQGIVSFLAAQNNIDIVGEADSEDCALATALDVVPDIILMDLQLADQYSGIVLTEKLNKALPSCQIIILTSYHQDDCIFPAFAAGALSYLVKDIHPNDLLDAIYKASQGDAVLSPVVARRLLNQHAPKQHPLVALTDRELAVLKLVAEGLNNAEIGEQMFISIKTVRSHVSNILSKLQLRDRTQAAIMAWQQGLMASS